MTNDNFIHEFCPSLDDHIRAGHYHDYAGAFLCDLMNALPLRESLPATIATLRVMSDFLAVQTARAIHQHGLDKAKLESAMSVLWNNLQKQLSDEVDFTKEPPDMCVELDPMFSSYQLRKALQMICVANEIEAGQWPSTLTEFAAAQNARVNAAVNGLGTYFRLHNAARSTESIAVSLTAIVRTIASMIVGVTLHPKNGVPARDELLPQVIELLRLEVEQHAQAVSELGPDGSYKLKQLAGLLRKLGD